MSAQVRHVVWDWNGTLLDDLHVVVAAASAACSSLGRDAVTESEYRASFTRPIELSYERLLGRPLNEGEWEHLSQTFHGSYHSMVAEARLASDALLALSAVKKAGLSQSLLSMWTHDELTMLVDAFGLTPWFERVDGQVSFGGGHKEDHLRRHLAALGLLGQDVFMIGDSLDDLHAAQAVGAPCVLVDSGLHWGESTATAGATLVGSLLEAVAVVGADFGSL